MTVQRKSRKYLSKATAVGKKTWNSSALHATRLKTRVGVLRKEQKKNKNKKKTKKTKKKKNPNEQTKTNKNKNKTKQKLGVLAHAFNPSTQEADFWVRGQPGLQSEF